MKKKRRLFGILLVITALIIMQLPVTEADAATSASNFKMEGNTLIKYQGTEKNVSVPDGVEIIGQDAFENNKDIITVVIPDSVTQIDAYAFWGCEKLETVVLGEGLTEIGDFVFANCKGLKRMTVPSNIRSIGIQTFVDCVNLTDITIPIEVSDIHETAFDGCYRLLIHAEAGSYADKYAEAFYVRQKEMPEYEDVSDYDAEEDLSDTSDDSDTDTDSTDDNSGEVLGSTKVVGNQAVVFIDNTSQEVHDGKDIMGELQSTMPGEDSYTGDGIPKYTIVDGIVVADQAFYRSAKLQKISLPDGIKEIGQFSFARSTVTQIMIPEGAEIIRYGAFYHCDSLQKVELPRTIMNVEPKAFTYTAWVEDFLQNATEDFLISGGVLVAYRGNSSHVTIPDGVQVIAGEVFAGHSEIKELALPDSLITIGEGAFENCSGLKSVYWGEKVRYIKDRAFAGSALTFVALPASVEALGLQAFDETVQMKYGGAHIPFESHELSAERLSNEAYRLLGEETGNPGVTVYGMDNSFAHLEGAVNAYTLTVVQNADKSTMEQAFERSLRSALPSDIIVYDMLFTDNSGVPITKLGKQSLQITLPVPESLGAKNLKLYTLDRNGQLEELEVQRVKLDGVDSFRFSANFVSQIAVAGNGTDFDAAYVITETTSMISMSSGPMEAQNNFYVYQWGLCGVLLLVGTICIFKRK